MATAGFRQTQKAATRRKVLAAARALFATDGYEAATVRQIANLAGVSVGSVFTTFPSKAHILSQVMEDRLEALYAELDRFAVAAQGSTVERLRRMFAIHFAFEFPHVQLFLAHVAAAYDWTLEPEAKPFGRNLRLQGLIEDCLRDGITRGEVDPAADVRAVVDLLLAAYAWTYRLAAWEQADAAAMTRAMDQQIGLIARCFEVR